MSERPGHDLLDTVIGMAQAALDAGELCLDMAADRPTDLARVLAACQAASSAVERLRAAVVAASAEHDQPAATSR